MTTTETNNRPKKPAKPRTAGKVLSAKPVKGKIDHEALTREIIARYPKILAALAK
jgi:hypothetical protein